MKKAAIKFIRNIFRRVKVRVVGFIRLVPRMLWKHLRSTVF